MAETLPKSGMVGPFWVVEEAGASTIIAVTVALEQADAYGDMLTVETGHLEHWSRLARRGGHSLREAGISAVPLWSEYEEWPRGRVLYEITAGRFVIRADRQLHRPAFVRLIADHFRIGVTGTTVLSDDHYRSIRSVPVPLLQ